MPFGRVLNALSFRLLQGIYFALAHIFRRFKTRLWIFKKSYPSPARPQLEPRTHLTRLHRLRLLWLRARSPILKRCGTSFPVQSPAPAVNTKALIGPRRALGRSLSAQTRGLLVGGSVGDAPLLSWMLLSVSGGEGTSSSETLRTPRVCYARRVSGAGRDYYYTGRWTVDSHINSLFIPAGQAVGSHRCSSEAIKTQRFLLNDAQEQFKQ